LKLVLESRGRGAYQARVLKLLPVVWVDVGEGLMRISRGNGCQFGQTGGYTFGNSFETSLSMDTVSIEVLKSLVGLEMDLEGKGG
jgi:hypothetical protein